MMQGDSVNSHPWAFGEPYYALDSLDSFRSVLGVPKSKQEWSTTQRDRMARFRPLLVIVAIWQHWFQAHCSGQAALDASEQLALLLVASRL